MRFLHIGERRVGQVLTELSIQKSLEHTIDDALHILMRQRKLFREGELPGRSDLLEILNGNAYDAIIISFGAEELAPLISQYVSLPLIYLSSAVSREEAEMTMPQGAAGYVFFNEPPAADRVAKIVARMREEEKGA